MINKNINKYIPQSSQSRRQVFRVIVGTLSLLCMCYVYFIGSITFNVLARKTLETSAREISSNVGALELQYITLSKSINASYGKDRGFVEARDTIFASRDRATVAIR